MSRALQEAAARIAAIAARGDTRAVVDALRPLRGIPAEQIEAGDAAAHATIFPLRRGAVLPLHDHPAMTVASKVLAGRLRIESFEWADRAAGVARDLGAREIDDDAEPLVFGPEPGRLHRITALTDCAFIDVFAPYYDQARPCRYYRIVGVRDGLIVLAEV
jgi:hypothetical protein